MKLMRKIRLAAQEAGQTGSGFDPDSSAAGVIDRMLDEFDRPGRAAGGPRVL